MNNYVYNMVCIFSVRTMCIIYIITVIIYTHARNLQCQVSLPQDLWIYLHNKKNISTWLAGHPRFVWKLPINHRLFVRMDGVEPPFHLSIFLAGISRNYGHFFFSKIYCKIDSQEIPLLGAFNGIQCTVAVLKPRSQVRAQWLRLAGGCEYGSTNQRLGWLENGPFLMGKSHDKYL